MQKKRTRLVFAKETVRILTTPLMHQVVGGQIYTGWTCHQSEQENTCTVGTYTTDTATRSTVCGGANSAEAPCSR
jgi:hypothetical protein